MTSTWQRYCHVGKWRGLTRSKIRRKDIVFVQKRRYGCLHVFQSDFRLHQISPSWKEQKKPKGKVKCGLAGKRSRSSTCAYLPGSQQPTRQSQHGTASRAAGMWPSPCPLPWACCPRSFPLPTGHWAALIVICLTTSPSHSAPPSTPTHHIYRVWISFLMLADVRSLPPPFFSSQRRTTWIPHTVLSRFDFEEEFLPLGLYSWCSII